MSQYEYEIRRFSRKNGAVNFTSKEGPIPMGLLEKLAPSVFASEKHESRSDKYAYIPTSDVVNALGREGFQPFSIMQGGSRLEAKRGFTKHLIRFRHESASSSLVVGAHHSEVCLVNSHDGTSAYKLFGGVFRVVCSNGLVVSESDVSEIKIPHKGDVIDRVVEGCVQVLSELPMVHQKIGEYSALQLSEGEKLAFATAALVAKYGDESPPIMPDALLKPWRREDRKDDAWSVLNVAQENLIRGGSRYQQRDERGRLVANRQTRAVNSVDSTVGVNRALWTLMSEMAKLKAA